jgi:hypothetical protein
MRLPVVDPICLFQDRGKASADQNGGWASQATSRVKSLLESLSQFGRLDATLKDSASEARGTMAFRQIAAWQLRRTDATLQSSRRNRNLENSVTLVHEEFVSFFNLVERKTMGYERSQICAARSQDIHQPSHPLLPTWA